MFTGATDDELALASRTTSGQWTLLRWRPFATQPVLTFATFDAYPSWVAFDSQRAIVYSEDEGTIVTWPRVDKATPSTILTNVPSSSATALASDGTNLVIRSQTALSTCAIADCENTLRPIQTPTTFTKARYLFIDQSWAYFFHSKSDSGPMTLVRVPR
ncbi:hypothetical protein AKJ09_00537 [Labilithrix luteola]|uniref:Uncharacterized protein n=2 Tax=Labilithrix luteola TaxID=1391654 RepID=A0A0K1PK04_9BACT|nr:hypothetical protein AKJ09_00537 [Labilithrix luteola]